MTHSRFRFRAWDVKYKCWSSEAIGVDMETGDPFFVDSDGVKQCAPDLILMQSTGLLDKNGVEIFEGDVLRYDGENIVIKPPEWQVIDAFMVHCRPGLDSFRDDYSREDEPSRQVREGEVIGNIYENKDLMK